MARFYEQNRYVFSLKKYMDSTRTQFNCKEKLYPGCWQQLLNGREVTSVNDTGKVGTILVDTKTGLGILPYSVDRRWCKCIGRNE